MTARDLLRRIVAALDRAGIPYMLTGSFASSYHGAPRASQDVDLVIEASRDRLQSLVRSTPPEEFYVDMDVALDALRRETQFNIVDLATGWKIDLIIRKTRAFSLEEFSRRREVELEGLKLFVATAEDVVVSKLEWAGAGASARQIEDVAGILRVRGRDLDRAYLERWVRELALSEQWETARRLAGSGA